MSGYLNHMQDIYVPWWLVAIVVWAVGAVILSIYRAAVYPGESWEKEQKFVLVWPVFMAGIVIFGAVMGLVRFLRCVFLKWPFELSRWFSKNT